MLTMQKSLDDKADLAKTQQATACYHSRQTFQQEIHSNGGSRGHESNSAGGNQWRTYNGMEDYSLDFPRRNPTHDGSKHNHFNNKPWRN